MPKASSSSWSGLLHHAFPVPYPVFRFSRTYVPRFSSQAEKNMRGSCNSPQSKKIGSVDGSQKNGEVWSESRVCFGSRKRLGPSHLFRVQDDAWPEPFVVFFLFRARPKCLMSRVHPRTEINWTTKICYSSIIAIIASRSLYIYMVATRTDLFNRQIRPVLSH